MSPPPPLNKSAALDTAIVIVSLCLIFQFTGCAVKTNKNIITETDIEIISWSIEKSGVGHAGYSLFTLIPAAAAKNSQLNDLINTILYRGQTAREYVEVERQVWEEAIAQATEYVGGWHEENFTWEIRGKYLLLKKRETGGGGSSYETVSSYIIDTALVKRLTIDDIIIDSGNSNLQELLWSRLLPQAEGLGWITLSEQDFFPLEGGMSFSSIFFEGPSLVFHWDKGTVRANAVGAFEVSLQLSEVLPFLTDAGREILD